MREIPILFSTEMVKALLDGRKTMTRRVVTVPWYKGKRTTPYEPYYIETDGKLVYMDECGEYHPMEGACPYGSPGTRLWVRETWAEVSSGIIEYKASYQEPYTGLSDIDHVGKKIKWKSPRFMPKVAARIWLEVTNVRVERLQEISDVDRLKEGISVMAATAEELLNDYKTTEMGRREFRELWDSLNAKRGYGWDVNPWVWVIEFKRVDHD